jgi:hypothetical protein
MLITKKYKKEETDIYLIKTWNNFGYLNSLT